MGTALVITEPRTVAASDLPNYVGWTLQPTLAQGRMIQGRILAASIDADNGVANVTYETVTGRGDRVPDGALITLERADFYMGSTGPHCVEVTTQHTVPAAVPGKNASEQYARIFDYIDARHGVTIAEAIAVLSELVQLDVDGEGNPIWGYAA